MWKVMGPSTITEMDWWTGLVAGGLTLKIIFTLLTRPILACGVMWKPAA